MFAGRALAVAVVALVGCAVLPTGAAAGISADALTLRLPDLGPNYATDGYPYCGENTDGTDAEPVVERLAQQFDLRLCNRTFSRSWVAPGGRLGARRVASAALLFPDAPDAIAAIESERELAAAMAGAESRSLAPRPAPALGDSAFAYDFERPPCCMIPAQPGSVRVWRSGRVVGLLATLGDSPGLAGVTDRLAAAQQSRIALPTLVTPPDFDDRFVALNDPGLGGSVPWLGERFAARRGLPALRLRRSDNHNGRRPDNRALSLSYSRRGVAVEIELWRPRAWARFKRSLVGREIFGDLCDSRVVRTRKGPIRLLAGNELSPCKPGQPPAHRFAVTRAGRFVAVVNGPFCSSCWDRPRRASRYESWPGLLAIARGLRPRQVPHSAN